MKLVYPIGVLVGIICVLGIVGTADVEDAQVAAQHKAETIAAMKKERAHRKAWEPLERQADVVWPIK